MTGDAARQKLARRIYVGVRHMMVGAVLRHARLGTLDPYWRANLPYVPSSEASRDSAVLVQCELAELPVQPWEPYAAHGDWREALDAWYSDTLAFGAEHETELLALVPRAMDGSLEWYASGRQLQEEVDRHTRESQRRERDCLGASYRAGLAAGGVEIDWVDWYRQRVAAWEDHGDEGMRIDYRRHEADQPGWREYLQQLPDYWTSAAAKLAG